MHPTGYRPLCPEGFEVAVYTADYVSVLSVPGKHIVHTPSHRKKIDRLVVCRDHAPPAARSCPMQEGCNFVHLALPAREYRHFAIHVNFRFESLEQVRLRYPLETEAGVVECLDVNGQPTVVQRDRCLPTLAFHRNRKNLGLGPVRVCHDFQCRSCCFLGRNCPDIHEVCVDGAAVRAWQLVRATKCSLPRR